MKRKNLDLQTHDEQGEHLYAMRAYLLDAYIRLAGTYGTSSREAKLAARALRDVDALRCVLDSRAWREWRAGDLYYNRSDVVERAIREALEGQDAGTGKVQP